MFQKFYPSEYYTSTYVIDFAEYYKTTCDMIGKIIKGEVKIVAAESDEEATAPATEEAIRFIQKLKEIGFGICLVSNNKEPRVAEFNKPLDVKYIYKAGKPKRTGYQKAMQLLGTDTANTVFVGDQLFTDLWGANNTGITSLLVMPIDKKEEIQIVLKRIPEKWILHSYLKKHQIVR